MSAARVTVSFTVNGRNVRRSVEPRLLLVDFIRNELRLTGTHVGCAHGVCGACTIMIDGRIARSCLAFVAQMEGATIETVESLAPRDSLSPIQQAFHEEHALQCGFCTPGFLLTARQLLADNPNPTEKEIRLALAGNLCRCTGYVHIIRAVKNAAAKLRADAAAPHEQRA
jgi:carbon-monoxide dehydrogenase small subunit